MDTHSLLAESLNLLLIGMGSVFIILSLLIVLITIISKYIPEESMAAHQPVARPKTNQQQTSNNGEVVAAISAAVNSFRSKNSSK